MMRTGTEDLSSINIQSGNYIFPKLSWRGGNITAVELDTHEFGVRYP